MDGTSGDRARVTGVSVAGRERWMSHGTIGGRRVDPDTVLYGASVTKQFIGYLVAEAVGAGLVDVAEPITERLPELSDGYSVVRVGHLLHHSSGIADATRGPTPVSNAEVLRRLVAAPPPSDGMPGDRFAYCNAGYILLAEILSRATGTAVPALASQQIFEPLDMANSRLGGDPIPIAGEPDPPGTIGDGGLWTSGRDLLRWLVALQSGSLDPSTVRRTERPTHFAAPASNYAWGVVADATDHGPRLTHGGTRGRRLAKTVRFPSAEVATVVLSLGGRDTEISELGIALAVAAIDQEQED